MLQHSITIVLVCLFAIRLKKMAYVNSLKFYSKFDSVPFINEIDGDAVSVRGTISQSDLVSTDFGFGWVLKPATYISYIGSFPITSTCSIGFRMKSVHLGLADNGGTLLPLVMPVISLCNFTNIHTPSTGRFCIYEKCLETGMNSLNIRLISGVDIETNGYSTGVDHSFVIVYNGGDLSVSVYMDGSVLPSTITGSVPVSLGVTISPLTINYGAYGSAATVVRNQGTIDEVFVSNSILSPTEITRITSFGVPYVYDTSLVNVQEIVKTIEVDDPTTIRIGDILSDDAHLYIGKSNGILLRGHRKIWGTRRLFGNSEELKSIESLYGTGNESGDKYTSSGGVLTVKNITIRV